MSGRPKVYEIKPSVEFKQPFRFDFDKPNSRDYVNDEITEYFNYGFNDTTMKGYINKLRLVCKTYNKNTDRNYQENQLELMRLNDDIPFDFGGFSSFYDKSLVENKNMKDLADGGDGLMEYFIQNHTFRAKNQMPLLSFVGAMYPSNLEDENVEDLDWLVTQIEHNLEKKFQEIKARETEIEIAKQQATHHRNSTWKNKGPWRGGERDKFNRDSRDKDKDRTRQKNRHRDDSRDRKKRKSKSRSRQQRRKDKDRSRSKHKKRKDSRQRRDSRQKRSSRDRKDRDDRDRKDSRDRKKDKDNKDHKKKSYRSRSKDYRSRDRDDKSKKKYRH